MKQKRSSHSAYCDVLQSPLGAISLIFVSSVLVGVEFRRPDRMLLKQTVWSMAAKKELAEYLEQGRKEFTSRTAFLKGTAFEQQVWRALLEIPYGETRTYKWLAEKVGSPHASRAVGNALSKNPIPILYPCHRIIESDGTMGGYSSGVDIKRRLLEIEYYTVAGADRQEQA